jgi:hypothetical protein
VRYPDGKVEILKKSMEAPIRLVIVVDPTNHSYGMLECGHTFEHQDEAFNLNGTKSVGCPECWREEEPLHSPRISTRNRLMVGVSVA